MGLKDDLLARAQTITGLLRNMSATTAGGLPNVTQAGAGAAVNHVEYRLSLIEELKQIAELLGCENTDQLDELLTTGNSGPFIVESFETLGEY